MDENAHCPICKDLFIIPRIYECGHTICEECMKNIDKTDAEKYNSVFDVVHYSCPMCRFETIISWKNRPINHSLRQILQNLPEYKERTKNSKIDFDKIIDNNSFYKTLNFSNLSFKYKFMKAEKYYHKLLPILYDAALQGKSKIVITKNVKDLKIISSLLSKKLWKHGILNIISTPREFIIYLLPENGGSTSEYINPTFSLSTHEISDSDNDILMEDEYNELINSYVTNNTAINNNRLLARYNY